MKRSDRPRGRALCAAALLVLSGTPADAFAQATSIAPSGLNTATPALNSTTTAITGGTRSGTNLFHSFGEFSVGTNHTALFQNSDGGATSNIFGRVTGGSESRIFGTIDSATNFPQANLWLLNPAGFLFGPTAKLNVGGSVNISTADYLRMTDGTLFNALPGPGDVLLSMAPVEAFGFLERQTLDPTFGRIAINGTQLGDFSLDDTDPGALKGLSLVGRDLVFNEAKLELSGTETVPSGLLLASLASAGEVRLAPLQGFSGIHSQITAGSTLGNIALNSTTIALSNSPFESASSSTFAIPAAMRFFSDIFTMSKSRIDGFHEFASGPGVVELNLTSRLSVGADSFIETGNKGSEVLNLIISAPLVEVNGGSITTVGGFNDNGKGGKIDISGDRVIINDGEIGTTFAPLLGGSGDLTLHLQKSLFIGANGRLFSMGVEDGTGAISIEAPVVDVNGGSIRTGASFFSGAITITGHTVRITNGEVSNALTSEGSAPGQSEGPKPITFDLTGALLLGPGSTISSSSSLNFPGGEISIRADSVRLQGSTINAQAEASPTLFSDFPLGEGKGGTITINARDGILLSDGSTITSEFTGPGKAGNIVLSAGRDLRIENGRITSAASLLPSLDTEGLVGTAGEIRLTAGHNLQLRNSRVETTSADGSGGNIKLTAPNAVLIADSTISSSVKGQKNSNGGNISIDPVAVAFQHSQILARANAGAGGKIEVVASGVLVDPSTRFDATASQNGTNGTVDINAPIQVLGGTLVPLKVSYSQPTLSGDRCAADPQGRFSSFVQTGRDGVPQIPGGYAPSPLLPLNRLISSSRVTQRPMLAATRLGLDRLGEMGTMQYQFQAGCRS